MELLKPKDNLTLVIDDVTFFIRPQMTAHDKFAIDIIGEYKDGHFTVDKGAVFEKLVELFVVGWSGVTEDGKDVKYSYDMLMHRLPGDVSKDWILKLGTFIIDAIGLIPKEIDQVKNA